MEIKFEAIGKRRKEGEEKERRLRYESSPWLVIHQPRRKVSVVPTVETVGCTIAHGFNYANQRPLNSDNY